MKNLPKIEIQMEWGKRSKDVLVYYHMTPTKDNVIKGAYCEDEFGAYWIETEYGLFIDDVYGWSEIHEEPDNK